MNFDPYKILGLPRDATPEQIKAAYRRAANQHHPDKGGDREEFEKVTKANLILSDAARRKKFDRTGDADEVNPDNTQMQIIQIALEAIIQVIQTLAQQRAEPEYQDMIALATAIIQDRINKAQQTIAGARVGTDKLKRVAARMKRNRKKKNGDFLGLALAGQIRQMEENILKSEAQAPIFEEAIKLLADYEYMREVMMPQVTTTFYSWS